MAKFAVGEIAIVTVSYMQEFPVGSEVEILEVYDDPEYQYLVYHEDHGPFGCRDIWGNDRCLRKKHPPEEEDRGSWDEIEKLLGWNPTKEKVVVDETTIEKVCREFFIPERLLRGTSRCYAATHHRHLT